MKHVCEASSKRLEIWREKVHNHRQDSPPGSNALLHCIQYRPCKREVNTCFLDWSRCPREFGNENSHKVSLLNSRI